MNNYVIKRVFYLFLLVFIVIAIIFHYTHYKQNEIIENNIKLKEGLNLDENNIGEIDSFSNQAKIYYSGANLVRFSFIREIVALLFFLAGMKASKGDYQKMIIFISSVSLIIIVSWIFIRNLNSYNSELYIFLTPTLIFSAVITSLLRYASGIKKSNIYKISTNINIFYIFFTLLSIITVIYIYTQSNIPNFMDMTKNIQNEIGKTLEQRKLIYNILKYSPLSAMTGGLLIGNVVLNKEKLGKKAFILSVIYLWTSGLFIYLTINTIMENYRILIFGLSIYHFMFLSIIMSIFYYIFRFKEGNVIEWFLGKI